MDKAKIVQIEEKKEVKFGHSPVKTSCPLCQSVIVTHITYEAGMMTWVLCFSLIFLG